MPFDALRYRTIECGICGGDFDSLTDFKGHDADGEPCEGGTPS